MHDFGSFCYLDVQKTGSTFLSDFLRRHCPGRELVHDKHGLVAARRPDTLYFITVRDPVDLYRSLYAYGVGGNGRLRTRLLQQGAGALYTGTPDAFARWLDAVLAPDGHALLSRAYAAGEARLYGFQTHRVLRLSFAGSRRVLPAFRSRADVVAAYRADRLHSVVLRNETLNEDLARLIDGPLGAALADPAAAKAELAGGPKRLNSSAGSVAPEALSLGAEARARIEAREWFFYDVLGYPPGATPASDAA